MTRGHLHSVVVVNLKEIQQPNEHETVRFHFIAASFYRGFAVEVYYHNLYKKSIY